MLNRLQYSVLHFYIHCETKKKKIHVTHFIARFTLLRRSGTHPAVPSGLHFCLLLPVQSFSTKWWEINTAQHVLCHLETSEVWGEGYPGCLLQGLKQWVFIFLDSGGLFKVRSGSEISSVLCKPGSKIPPTTSLFFLPYNDVEAEVGGDERGAGGKNAVVWPLWCVLQHGLLVPSLMGQPLP